MKTKVSTFSLTMLNVTAIVSLSAIAYMSTIGLTSIFFYLIAALFFLVPSTLVCAELSSMISEDNGGIFSWVKAGLGKRAGLVAMWLEWFNNAISFPGNISAIVASIAYVGFRSVIGSHIQLWLLMMLVFAGVTLFNFLPMRRVVLLNVVGAVFGMMLPGVLLISGAAYYIFNGQSNIQFNGLNDLFPVMSLASFALLAKALAGYSGIQSVAFHVRNIDNPKRSIPMSMFFAAVIILVLTVCSTLALMTVIPMDKVNVLNGLVQGVAAVLASVGLARMEPVIALLVGLGMLASLSTWMLGPARGMQVAAEQKMFPRSFSGKNKAGMPVNMLLIQFGIGLVISLAFLLMPTVYAAFALIIALTSQFTVLMWIMVFISVIRLRYVKPNANRLFYVGARGKNSGLIIISTLAILACVCAFVAGLFPPGFTGITSVGWYALLVFSADAVIIAIPLLWVWLYHKRG